MFICSFYFRHKRLGLTALIFKPYVYDSANKSEPVAIVNNGCKQKWEQTRVNAGLEPTSAKTHSTFFADQ